MRRLTFLALLAATGCADPALEARIAQLETEVAALKAAPPAAAKGAPGAAPGAPGAPVDNARNEAAIALFKEAQQLVAAKQFDQAKAKLNELQANYGDTPAARSGAKVLSEIDIIGKPAAPLAVEKWYQGQTAVDPNKATLLVFWEVWCPHCKREVPKLEQTAKDWSGKGLQVIGLTKQTRDITDEQVAEFIKANNVTYPIGREQGGTMSTAYGVSGIPAAAVIKNNQVLWRGHPAQINEEMLKTWTGS